MADFKDLAEDDRRGAQGLFWHPIHPTADSTIDQANRQQVIGVYPNVLAGAATGAGIEFWEWHHHYKHNRDR